MQYLSEAFKQSGFFNSEFDKIFAEQPFDKPNILAYINVCTTAVLEAAQRKYPQHGLKFINPIFIVNREIYPVPGLPGDERVMKLAYESFGLVNSRTIVPLSLKVLDNRMFGLVLYFNDSYKGQEYMTFRTFDLGNTTNNNDDKIKEGILVDEVSHLEMDINTVTGDFHKIAAELELVTTKEKMKLYKTFMLYKNMARLSERGMFFSFVNNYNQAFSFFNCLFTLVSEKPFTEEELLDFALIIDNMSAPIAGFYSDPKGVSVETMAKRNAIKSVLESSFKQV